MTLNQSLQPLVPTLRTWLAAECQCWASRGAASSEINKNEMHS